MINEFRIAGDNMEWINKQNVLIVGLGLMGGSYARALKRGRSLFFPMTFCEPGEQRDSQFFHRLQGIF